MFDVVISVVVLAVVALLWGARVNWRAGDRQRAMLMIVAALVLAGNAAIWLMPTPTH
jgi:hypothetical protein